MSRRRAIAALVGLGLALDAVDAGADAAAPRPRGALDYGAGLSARSLPLGLIFNVDLGYSRKLWDAGGLFTFGYIRPAIEIESIGVNSRVGGRLDLFPIAIFGIVLRSEYGHRFIDPEDFDCEVIACVDGIWRHQVEAKAALKVGPVAWLPSAALTWAKMADDDRVFYEDRSVLLGAPGGDRFWRLRNFVATSVTSRLTIGALHEWNHADLDDGTQQVGMLLGRWTGGQWAVAAGGGYYASNRSPDGVTVVGALSWTGDRGLPLF